MHESASIEQYSKFLQTRGSGDFKDVTQTKEYMFLWIIIANVIIVVDDFQGRKKISQGGGIVGERLFSPWFPPPPPKK